MTIAISQVLVGDVDAANSSHREFFHVWKKFGVLPERYFIPLLLFSSMIKCFSLYPRDVYSA